jgi:hypothetical protein
VIGAQPEDHLAQRDRLHEEAVLREATRRLGEALHRRGHLAALALQLADLLGPAGIARLRVGQLLVRDYGLRELPMLDELRGAVFQLAYVFHEPCSR